MKADMRNDCASFDDAVQLLQARLLGLHERIEADLLAGEGHGKSKWAPGPDAQRDGRADLDAQDAAPVSVRLAAGQDWLDVSTLEPERTHTTMIARYRPARR
jgi:hypothetical protein